jgi:hypothetical protein
MEVLEIISLLKTYKIQLGLSKLNPAPYNLHMVNETIAKPLDLIKDLKIFVHGIPYIVTIIVINNNFLDSSYSMLLGHPWLKDAKLSHDWGNNIVIIQGTCIVRTIPIIKKLGGQTKRPEVLMCYDFHFGISNEKKDVMFAIELNMFSLRIIIIPTHTKLISKYLTYQI